MNLLVAAPCSNLNSALELQLAAEAVPSVQYCWQLLPA